MLHHMENILVCYGSHFEPKWPPKYKNPPIWTKFGFQHDRVKNWALIISCYVLTLFFIHTTSTCIVRLGDICNALRYSNQYLYIIFTYCGFQQKYPDDVFHK